MRFTTSCAGNRPIAKKPHPHLLKYRWEISLLCLSRLRLFETNPCSVHEGEALRGLKRGD